MRTTLTLDDDIAPALRDRARELNRSFEQVVNEALRRGMSLTAREDLPVISAHSEPQRLWPWTDPLRLNQRGEDL